ncbi:hypothetical protein CRUP_024730 [Coryphaenoides rupestris]|nr:hypothetical protein CRUP_024730 [Coryphaenoides rupestris]
MLSPQHSDVIGRLSPQPSDVIGRLSPQASDVIGRLSPRPSDVISRLSLQHSDVISRLSPRPSDVISSRLLRYRGLEDSVFSLTGRQEDEEDDEDDAQFDTSDSSRNHEVLAAGSHQYTSIQEFASAIPNHLLLGSLLEHLCFVYESDPTRSRMLFKATMNLLSPLAVCDELSTVRLQHNRAFTELLHAASSSLGQQRLNADTLGLPMRPKEGLFQAQTSRYLSEFEEISRLGNGAYGKVFKVLNKLDGQHYAVKKILIKNVSREDCMKVLREVKVLSSLQHISVVGYHTAWMEHVQPTGQPNSLLPALESPAPLFSGDEILDSSSAGSSIVFQNGSCVEPDSAPGAEEDAPWPITALLPSSSPCPKLLRRLPESYVPCVFLSQKAAAAAKAKVCPSLAWEGGALERDGTASSGADTKPESRGDTGQFHLMLYIQMQLCELSLKDWIWERNDQAADQRASRCPYACVDAEHTLGLLRKTLEGVEYIHSKGIMHRDLKSSARARAPPRGVWRPAGGLGQFLRNIFLHGHDWQVRIGDFGLACKDILANDQDPLASTCHRNGSAHTTGVGTFVYAAPEQLDGSYYDSQSDMYSVGVLALELFQPFGTEMERAETLKELREGRVPDSFCRRWPVLGRYVTQLTSREPAARPTARQLLQSELFNSKDVVIHGLQQRVEEQEEEIIALRRRISELQTSQESPGGSGATGH